jgi:hypothetical protein
MCICNVRIEQWGDCTMFDLLLMCIYLQCVERTCPLVLEHYNCVAEGWHEAGQHPKIVYVTIKIFRGGPSDRTLNLFLESTKNYGKIMRTRWS